MSKFLNNDDDDRTMTIPTFFFKNSPAKKSLKVHCISMCVDFVKKSGARKSTKIYILLGT